MTANIHPTTGIRYGAISGNSLDPEVLDALYLKASAAVYDQLYEARKQELRTELSELFDQVADDIVFDEAATLLDTQLEREAEAGEFGNDEPSADIEHEGVKLHYGYLGGAVLLIVTESPHKAHGPLCSPCVPNAVSLPAFDGDYEAYDVPSDWYYNPEA